MNSSFAHMRAVGYIAGMDVGLAVELRLRNQHIGRKLNSRQLIQRARRDRNQKRNENCVRSVDRGCLWGGVDPASR